MIIKVPLYIKNEDWIKLVKSMTMKMKNLLSKSPRSDHYLQEIL